MNYTRQFLWHAFLTVTTTILNGVLFYALRIVLYDHLTAEEYGLFYTLFSFMSIVQLVVTFGFDPGLVPYVTQFREEKNHAATKSIVAGALVPQGIVTILIVGALLIAPEPVAHWLTREPAAPALLRILSIHALLVILFKAGQQVLLGEQLMGWRNGSDLARAIVCVASAAWMLHAGFGVYATAIAYALGAFAEVAVQAAGLLIALPLIVRARFTWRTDLVSQAFDSGKWLSLAFGGVAIFSSVDTLMISLVRGNLTDAAAYQIALPTVTILYSLLVAAALSLMPMVRTLWLRGEREQLATGISRLYAISIVCMIPGGVVLAGTSDSLMGMLFSGRVLNASDAFDVLALGGLAFFLTHVSLHTLAGIGQARAAGLAVALGLGVDLLCSPLLTWWLGIRGTAIAGTAGYCICATVGTLCMRRHLALSIRWQAVIGGTALGLITAGFMYAAR